jgi:penicillin-binding protein 1B
MSLNNATVELAQMVGYGNVAALAREAGITRARGTPAVALGAYDATPLDVAGAYTMFSNYGARIEPWMLASVRTPTGEVMQNFPVTPKPILDPRAAYLTLSLMKNVIDHGTAFPVRALGFTAPAAGKTGTSHDAWFAGFTSNLLCVIWIGNDDYSDIKLEGGKVAAPVWAAFMKQAVKLPQYSDTKDFEIPAGVTILRIDSQTNLLADETCPTAYYAAFLDGTGPTRSAKFLSEDFRRRDKADANSARTDTAAGDWRASPAAESHDPGQYTSAAATCRRTEKEEGILRPLIWWRRQKRQSQSAAATATASIAA